MAQVTLYATAGSAEEAGRIGRALVQERLAACVNVFDGIRSFYWWEGAVQDDTEAVLIAKTRADLAAAAIARIRELHSYAVPCVTILPISAGNPEFLAWIDAETRR